jgi:Uncharacterized protein predicted to be involved in DNA repair (RAMP superfamily)
MARKCLVLFDVEAVLTAAVAIHIGNSDDEHIQDAPIAVDGRGQPYLPGTSLAGPIRAWWRDVFGDDRIWGAVEEKGHRQSLGYASFITIEDAPATVPAGLVAELREGVGIDRYSGAAAERIKYDRQVLPAGTTFGLRLRLEVPVPRDTIKPKLPEMAADEAETCLVMLLKALEAGDIRFGAAKTSGLGRLHASDVVLRRFDMSSASGVLARLRPPGQDDPARIELKEGVIRPSIAGRVEFRLHWTARTPVFSQAGLQGATIDAMPLLTGGRDGETPGYALVLTGASIKGVLRAQAERICRTLRGDFGALSPHHLDQIALSLVECLFGGPGRSKESATNEKASRIGRGALSVDDCRFGPQLSPAEQQSVVGAGADADIANAVRSAQNAIDALKWGGARISQHVAIDRWTGGASKGPLFNRLEPGRSGGVIRMTLDTDRLGANGDPQSPDAAMVLLLFLLRDLAKGRIPVGFGANRGLGSIALEKIEIVEVGEGAARKFGLAPRSISGEDLAKVGSVLLDCFLTGTILSESGEARAAAAHLADVWRSYWNEVKSAVETAS